MNFKEPSPSNFYNSRREPTQLLFVEWISQNHVWQLILAFRIGSNFSEPVFNIGGKLWLRFYFRWGGINSEPNSYIMYISSEINDLSVDINDQ